MASPRSFPCRLWDECSGLNSGPTTGNSCRVDYLVTQRGGTEKAEEGDHNQQEGKDGQEAVPTQRDNGVLVRPVVPELLQHRIEQCDGTSAPLPVIDRGKETLNRLHR